VRTEPAVHPAGLAEADLADCDGERSRYSLKRTAPFAPFDQKFVESTQTMHDVFLTDSLDGFPGYEIHGESVECFGVAGAVVTLLLPAVAPPEYSKKTDDNSILRVGSQAAWLRVRRPPPV
jgi:hypothetical protein